MFNSFSSAQGQASLLALFLGSVILADEPVRRAERPDWKTAKAGGVFFEDAFAEGLRGPRPDHLGTVTVAGSPGTKRESGQPVDGVGRFAWSRLISADSLEDKVKSLRMELEDSVRHPAQFAGGGHRTARRQFVMLTCLFAIVREFDRDVRWKKEATAARDRCRMAAQVSKTGSIQAFNAAKAVREEVADLIGGNSISVRGEPTENQWETLADRGSLMQQLELSFTEVIQPATAQANTFRSQQDSLRLNAELAAAVAEILTRDNLEDAGDEDYDEYCHRIQAATSEIVEAIRDKSFSRARAATGEINKACSECHESYRD